MLKKWTFFFKKRNEIINLWNIRIMLELRRLLLHNKIFNLYSRKYQKVLTHAKYDLSYRVPHETLVILHKGVHKSG